MKSNSTTTVLNFTLKFGKYNGEKFFYTPKSYQDWLLAQDWFKVPTQFPPFHLDEDVEDYYNNMLQHYRELESQGIKLILP